MSIDIPTTDDLSTLTGHRHDASVSFYVPSGWSGSQGGSDSGRPPIAHDTEAARIALRSAANDALAELAEAGVSSADRNAISDALEALDGSRSFWGTHARSVAVFVSPDGLQAFRLRNELPQHTAIGDRFDVGPLVRATTFDHNGFVLALTVGEVRLLSLSSDTSSEEIELTALPADAADALEHATTGGRFDRHRAAGTLGPKVGQRNYCSIVQDAVLEAIGESTAPLVLAAASDLEPAYREINTHPALLDEGIEANPASLNGDELAQRARVVLDEHYRATLADWRETFGSLQAHGRASSQLSDIARAATAGLVDTLLFDFEWTAEGVIDDAGAVTMADEPSASTYGLVDELAARVLRTGGTVRAVRRDDLPDDSAVAATFRASA